MIVPHRLVKGYGEPSMELAGHVVYGDFLLLTSLVVLDCLEAGLHRFGEHELKVSNKCMFCRCGGSASGAGCIDGSD